MTRSRPREEPLSALGVRAIPSRGRFAACARAYRGGMTTSPTTREQRSSCRARLGRRDPTARQALGSRIVAVDGLTMRVERGEVFGFLWPERRRQDDDAADAARARAPDVGQRPVLGARPRIVGEPRPARRADRVADLLSLSFGSGQPSASWRGTRALRETRIAAVLEEVELSARAMTSSARIRSG